MEGQAVAIEQLIADFQERDLPKVTSRDVLLPAIPGKADVIVGMRRSGKTFFLFQQIEELQSQGIERSRCSYINFEDERLLPLNTAVLSQIPEAFYRRFPESRNHTCYFFFDEIHNVPGWEKFIRRFIDNENVHVTITGSSAKLLSKEIATSMRGRSISTEILPFSFAEALHHVNIPVPKRWPTAARSRSKLAHQFNLYLSTGGFPEVQDLDTNLRVRILQEYLDVTLLRDVIERNQVTNVVALRYLVRRLIRSFGSASSIHRIHNELRSQGIRVSKDIVYEYFDNVQDAFLLFTVERQANSEKQRQVNPRKYYLVDHALADAISMNLGGDIGHKLENIVYLELRRRGFLISYWITSSKYEVDFYVTHTERDNQLIQVSADISVPDVRQRELRALEEALEETGLKEATLITLDESSTIKSRNRTIDVIPAWQWLIQDQLYV